MLGDEERMNQERERETERDTAYLWGEDKEHGGHRLGELPGEVHEVNASRYYVLRELHHLIPNVGDGQRSQPHLHLLQGLVDGWMSG